MINPHWLLSIHRYSILLSIIPNIHSPLNPILQFLRPVLDNVLVLLVVDEVNFKVKFQVVDEAWSIADVPPAPAVLGDPRVELHAVITNKYLLGAVEPPVVHEEVELHGLHAVELLLFRLGVVQELLEVVEEADLVDLRELDRVS